MSFRNLIFTLTTVLLLSPLAHSSPQHEPMALLEIVERSQLYTDLKRQPIVIIDLDDTLINTRERNLRILRDFAEVSSIKQTFPSEALKVKNLNLDQIRYLLADSLKGIGIENLDFIKAASDFWLSRFFSNEYCSEDLPTKGAAQYLQQLENAGAKIIYLTGRDVPRMETGTLANLKRNSFPLEKAKLMMKPDPKMDDLVFKQQAFVEIDKLGEVVGVIENEPANINAMKDAFPQATAVFLDTIHSPKPDVPKDGVHWVQDFTISDAINGIEIKEAILLACKEANRVHFDFETSCEDDFFSPQDLNISEYLFMGIDASGDCGITVLINRLTGAAKSNYQCD